MKIFIFLFGWRGEGICTNYFHIKQYQGIVLHSKYSRGVKCYTQNLQEVKYYTINDLHIK